MPLSGCAHDANGPEPEEIESWETSCALVCRGYRVPAVIGHRQPQYRQCQHPLQSTRQRVELTNNRPDYVGGLSGPQYIGSGVSAVSVSRVYDNFLTEQARNYGSSVGQLEAKDRWTTQLDGVLGDGSTVSSGAQAVFRLSAGCRQQPGVIASAAGAVKPGGTLAGQFNNLDGQMNVLRDGVNAICAGR